jgi:hypothetical protein
LLKWFEGLRERDMEQELQQRSKTTAKTHEEIMKIMEELKAYEEKYKEYELSEITVSEKIEEVLVEFEPVGPEFLDTESSKASLKNKFVRRKNKKTAQELEKQVEPEANETKPKQSKAKPTQDTVFKLRFGETGNLEMLGAKKHPVKQTKPETKGAKKLSLRRKNKTESETKEEKSKLSKLKGGAGKIKNIIPHRKKKEETKEIKKQESSKYE